MTAAVCFCRCRDMDAFDVAPHLVACSCPSPFAIRASPLSGLVLSLQVVDLTSQYSSELLQIETTVSELQARKQSQLSRKRQLGRALLLYGSVVWLLLAAVLYLIELPNRTHFVAKCVRIGPLIGWPVGSVSSSSSGKEQRGIGIRAGRGGRRRLHAF